MLRALGDSFEVVNVGALRLNNQIFQEVVTKAGSMFAVAMKIGAPAIAALFFLKVVFGLITKFIPQMNIMIVAFPVQIIVGLIFFSVCLNGLLYFIQQYMDDLGALMMNVMMQMKI